MKLARHTKAFALIAGLLWPAMLLAGIGDIDPTYGNRGILPNRGYWNLMTAMPDGRVVTATQEDDVLNLFMADASGQPDVGFAPDGHLSVPLQWGASFEKAFVSAAAAAPGSIYLGFDTVNQSSTRLVRMTSTGALDTGFGMNGVATLTVTGGSPPGTSGNVLSIAPLANGRIAVLVGYFRSIYDCASDLRIFGLTSDGHVDFEYDHLSLFAALGGCSEFGGIALRALGNGYLSLITGGLPTVFDPSGRPVQLRLDQTGVSGNTVSLSPDLTDNHVYVAGPAAHQASTCAVSRLLPDMSHTTIDGDGDDSIAVDFGSVSSSPGEVLSCDVLASVAAGFLFVEAQIRGADGKILVAICRLVFPVAYYISPDWRFGSRGIAVVGAEADFGLFAVQADGSLLLHHGAYVGGPIQGGNAVVKLLASNLPSPGLIYVETPPYPVIVSQGVPTTVSVRRALGSTGAVSATYLVSAQHDGPPASLSPVRNLTFTWSDGEQGARSIEAFSASDAVGGYDVGPTAISGAMSFLDHGSFSIVTPAANPPSTVVPVGGSTGSGASGGSTAGGGASGADTTPGGGGGSLDVVVLLILACMLMRRLAGGLSVSRDAQVLCAGRVPDLLQVPRCGNVPPGGAGADAAHDADLQRDECIAAARKGRAGGSRASPAQVLAF